ncbi:MCE family protein [Mycolicibacterium neoaurum]|nr:MCE family protein [Mycolicibacterium neoaurum]
MPDAIGLYVGNPVTQMGYSIGTVAAVTASSTSVRVDFSVDSQRKFPAGVKAIIRSTSILADRALELVGNYHDGPQLLPGECVPLENSTTPKSLSEVIGSTTDFLNAISPSDSTDISGVIRGVDEATQDIGVGVNRLLTTSSAVVSSPQLAISDLGSAITNMATLTSTVVDMRDVLKQTMLDAQQTTRDVATGMGGATDFVRPVGSLVVAVSDIEKNLGEDFQKMLDSMAVFIRKGSQHAPWIAGLLNPVPWWINSLANRLNNHDFDVIRLRPPLYRVRTPDGLLQCGLMNARVPQSCADVAGMPYSVDLDLLKYVLTEAGR